MLRLDWTPLRSATQYQVVRHPVLQLGPPTSAEPGEEVYRGPELSCRVGRDDNGRYFVRGLDRSGKPVTDWSAAPW